MPDEDTGELLCTISWAGRRLWSVAGFSNLFVFEYGLAVVRTTFGEMFSGAGSSDRSVDEWLAGQRAALEIEARDIEDAVARHPDNRLIRRAEIAQARLRKGVIDSRLIIRLATGGTRRWVWTHGGGFRGKLTPNAPFAEAEAALRRMLGPALTSEP